MKEHIGFNPPELCEHCEEYYQYRNSLCLICLIKGQDRRAEERHDREVLERGERSK